jgi:hypothetical protein
MPSPASPKPEPPADGRGILKDVALSPLAPMLEATAAVLPFLQGGEKKKRFTAAQRADWDIAARLFCAVWRVRQSKPQGWQALRQAVVLLLEGALPLEHPAPMKLAEALAEALDAQDTREGPPPARLIAAFSATAELLGAKDDSADFLEHEALDARIEQLAARLGKALSDAPSETLFALFVREALPEIEEMVLAMDAMPPDVLSLADAAERLAALCQPLELAALAHTARRFGETALALGAATLDADPARSEALGLIQGLQDWITRTSADERLGTLPPATLLRHQKALTALTGGRGQVSA